MQEIKKRRILLASVLKPVDEPRMFERMGQSFAANGYDVFIIGFPPSSNLSVNGIHFLPHKRIKRISLDRIKIRLKVLGKALSIRPDVFIISTHELIGVALLYRIFTGKKIVYDVQENYWQNIMYTNVWPKAIKPLIALMVRLKETIIAPFFSKFLLAERCYADELSFTKNKSAIIENKCRVPGNFQRDPSKELIQLIFTGTIAESTGIFQAIDLAKKLHEVEPKIRLNIVGHCAQPQVLDKIESIISKINFISLHGGNDFIPHEQVMEAIATANFGIVYYPPSPHTKNKIPTKLYEYLACQLPVLLQNNLFWIDTCEPLHSAIVADFSNPEIGSLIQQIHERSFYSQKAENALWVTEESKLLNAIDPLI